VRRKRLMIRDPAGLDLVGNSGAPGSTGPCSSGCESFLHRFSSHCLEISSD
jgi:hypothetical protein